MVSSNGIVIHNYVISPLIFHLLFMMTVKVSIGLRATVTMFAVIKYVAHDWEIYTTSFKKKVLSGLMSITPK